LKDCNEILRYLQGIKNYMLTYRKCDYLEMIGYLDLDFVGCVDKKNPYYNIYFV
jgi:hypothetical protein